MNRQVEGARKSVIVHELRRYAYGWLRYAYRRPPVWEPPVCGRRRRGADVIISAAVPHGRRIRGVPIWALAGMHTGGPGMHTGVFVIPGITDRRAIRLRPESGDGESARKLAE